VNYFHYGGDFPLRIISPSIHTISENIIEWEFRVREKLKHNTRDKIFFFLSGNPIREKNHAEQEEDSRPFVHLQEL